MTIDEIERICFVGAGNMGCYNATWAAVSGYDVVLYDLNAASLEQVPQHCRDWAGFLAGAGYCEAEDVPAALARISCATDLAQAIAGADLISESVFERLDIKRQVHEELDRLCPQHTIITTNSSVLPVSEIGVVVQRGERFAALHSHMASPLIDIVGGGRTSPAIIDILERYVRSLNGVPLVLKKEHPGYVLNAILGPVLATAQSLVVDGVACIEDVDRAWMASRSAPMGPFGLLDLFGLNLIYDRWLHREDEGPVPGLRPKALELLRPLVERQELGMQSGKGFYRYPDPAYQQDDFAQTGTDLGPIARSLEVALVASALVVASADVAEPADIDRAWVAGTALDIGPFEILRQMGVAEFSEQFAGHVATGRFAGDRAALVKEYLCNTWPVAEKRGSGA